MFAKFLANIFFINKVALTLGLVLYLNSTASSREFNAL